MKSKLIFLIVLVFCSATKLLAQNPFKSLGVKNVKVATFSGGKYNEFFDEDSIVQIGTVLFNTNTNKIIAFVKEDTTYSEATLAADVTSRWLSPDPLADKLPHLSPYNFCSNNPIKRVDKDGRLDDDYYFNATSGTLLGVRRTAGQTDNFYAVDIDGAYWQNPTQVFWAATKSYNNNTLPASATNNPTADDGWCRNTDEQKTYVEFQIWAHNPHEGRIAGHYNPTSEYNQVNDQGISNTAIKANPNINFGGPLQVARQPVGVLAPANDLNQNGYSDFLCLNYYGIPGSPGFRAVTDGMLTNPSTTPGVNGVAPGTVNNLPIGSNAPTPAPGQMSRIPTGTAANPVFTPNQGNGKTTDSNGNPVKKP